MIGVAMYTTIKTLKEKGLNKSQIARATKHDWKTVSKALKIIESGKDWPTKKPHPRILDKHKETILRLIEQGLSGIRIFEELQTAGVSIGYSTVKEYLAEIKKKENIFIRIHTLPGEEAQVDFGYVGYTPDNKGKRRKTWVFNMRMSYSRKDYYEKVNDQRVETFIRCHIKAFEYFKGVPDCVRIDNLKAAVLEANFYEPVYQKTYEQFAQHYDFKIIPCRIYHPNDKGKVESGIKYVKGNFFTGRRFFSENDLERQLLNWMNNTCNARIHGTTRKVPNEVFAAEEKPKLKPLPVEVFKIADVGTRKVYHDCHIFVGYNYYSIPFEYVGKEVEIELTTELLRVYYCGKQICLHARLKGQGEFSTNENHYPRYKRYSQTEYQERYQVKMAQIGEFAEQIFFLLVERCPRDWSRPVQGILSLTKSYASEVINLSCKRALSYGVHQYQIIKNICSNGSYALPVEFNISEDNNEYIKN
ncbi:MAG: IS21 family transposase [Candidatus Omnitrophota bacterium]